ncbi:MAG: FadR family transcriptional regulator [Anaerolineales bacterium]|nr:FadR family transcriptional regulator [Anaerolineales bacterium]
MMVVDRIDSALLRYIAERGGHAGSQLPSIEKLSEELGVSAGKLREQLEVARSLGLVEVRPKLGIRLTDYSFQPAVRQSLFYALACRQATFGQFSVLRQHLEAAFWHEAVAALRPEDHAHLQRLITDAQAKLNGRPIQIPQTEHRELHLTIFSRLDNPFVTGLLAAYWDAYEAVGLSLYSDYGYLQEVWSHHAQIVTAVVNGDVDGGHRLLVEHWNLLAHRGEAGTVATMASIG